MLRLWRHDQEKTKDFFYISTTFASLLFLLYRYLDYATIMKKIFLFFISLQRSLCKNLHTSASYTHYVTNLPRNSSSQKNVHNLKKAFFLRNSSVVLHDLLSIFLSKNVIFLYISKIFFITLHLKIFLEY